MDLLVFAPAIEAYDAGSQVLIISKNRKGDPHAVLARGGINAALGTMDPNDNWLVHAAILYARETS